MDNESELAQVSALMNNSIDAIISGNSRGEITFFNKAAERIFGIGSAEAAGKSLSILLPEKDREVPSVEIKRFLTTSISRTIGHTVEMDGLHADGKIFPMEVSSFGWKAANGEDFFTAIIRDVSERKKTERDIISARNKYEELVEQLPVGIYRNTPGPSGHFLEANPAIVRMFEADSREDFLKHNVSELYYDPIKRAAFSEKTIRQGFIKNEEIQLKTLKGKPLWGSVTAMMRKSEKGEIYFDGVIIDITERKKSEAELIKSRTEYKELFDTISVGIFKSTPGPTGEFIEANPAVIRIFDADSREDLFSHKPGELYKNPDERKMLSEKILAEGFVKDIELHLRTFKGRDVVVISSIFLKKDDSGRAYFYGSFTDITDRKKGELEIVNKIQELERLNALMVDREIRMIELKAEIKKLKERLGEK